METKPSIDKVWIQPIKKCSLCEEERERNEFSVVRRHGKWVASSWCKSCYRARKKTYYYTHQKECQKYSRKYYEDNKEEVDAYWARRRKECREHLRALKKAEYERNKTRYRATAKYLYERTKVANRPKRAAYAKRKRLTDPQAAVKGRLRHRVREAVKDQGVRKHTNTMELVGCTIEELLIHLERQFLPGMSWENLPQWHIDHIRPCSSFDLTDPEQQKQCFNYTNLQPLWALDNIKKGAKYGLTLPPQPIYYITMPETDTTDYTQVIRAEIEREVERLKSGMKSMCYFIRDEDGEIIDEVWRTPVAVELGYLTNSHHGRPIFKDGDEIAGLPVRIKSSSFHRITVKAHTGNQNHDLHSLL